MPRNTALHGPRQPFVAPVPAANGGNSAAGPRGSTGSNFSATSAKSGDSGTSIATTPANQLPATNGGIAAPSKLMAASVAPNILQTPSAVGGALSIAAIESRMKANCSAEAGMTPWPTARDATAPSVTAVPGRVLNFSGVQDSPVANANPPPGAGGAVCHCPSCNIQVVSCMQCAAPMQPGPLGGAAASPAEPPKSATAYSFFKEDQIKEQVAKGTPAKIAAGSVGKLWAAASESTRKEYTLKAKEANAAAAAAFTRGKRIRDGDQSTATTPAKEKVKRPPSAYANFNSAKRAEVSAEIKAEAPAELEGADLAKHVFRQTAGRLSAMWKELSEEEKEKYKHPVEGATSQSAAPSAAPVDEEATPAVETGDDAALEKASEVQADTEGNDDKEEEEVVTTTSEKCDSEGEDVVADEASTPSEE